METQSMSVDKLQLMLWNFAQHRVITVASRTGILQHLEKDWSTPEETATQLGLDLLPTAKVMRALTALALLEADDDQKLSHNDFKKYQTTQSLLICQSYWIVPGNGCLYVDIPVGAG